MQTKKQKLNEFLVEHGIKTRLVNCPNMSIEAIFMIIENNKMSEPCRFVINFLQRLDLRSSNKHFAFQNLSIYYTRKNIK